MSNFYRSVNKLAANYQCLRLLILSTKKKKKEKEKGEPALLNSHHIVDRQTTLFGIASLEVILLQSASTRSDFVRSTEAFYKNFQCFM